MSALPSNAETTAADIKAARERLATHLADLHRLHIVLAQDSRELKRFTAEGNPLVEIQMATELLEQYIGASNAFLENMHGRLDVRLTVLRRGEPITNGRPENAPGHATFWLAFSRMCAVLRRAQAIAGS